MLPAVDGLSLGMAWPLLGSLVLVLAAPRMRRDRAWGAPARSDSDGPDAVAAGIHLAVDFDAGHAAVAGRLN